MVSTIGHGLLLLVFMPLIPRRWRAHSVIVAFLLVSLIGFARLALGVHYITDVVGGFVLGLAWLAAAGPHSAFGEPRKAKNAWSRWRAWSRSRSGTSSHCRFVCKKAGWLASLPTSS
jgi:membrane-associated phospholipid phosphatase